MPDRGLPFDFEIPVSFFEKAGAPEGKQRRVGGIISTESKDNEDETVLQRGLDFSYFLKNGWFNDNHSKKTTDILGYPEVVSQFQKGATLPDGKTAPNRGTWVEGYLLDHEEADKVWTLGQALQKTNRRLGWSLEGKIRKRIGPRKRTIAKALVRNAAITNCPVQGESRLELLSKSLQAVENDETEYLEELEKMLGMGTVETPGVAPTGPQTGMGAGQVLATESLERDDEPRAALTKSLTDTEAIAWIRTRLPQVGQSWARRFVNLTKQLKQAGRL